MRPAWEDNGIVTKPIDNLLFYGMYLDRSAIQVVDPEIEISELDVIAAKANNNGIITIDDPPNPLSSEPQKLFYPITIDVSKITIQRITPTVRLTLQQLQTKTHFPVSELTDGAFDAANNFDITSQIKLEPVNANTVVRYNDVVNDKLTITDRASAHNIDGITNYQNVLTLPLDSHTINVNDNSTVTVNASSYNLIGFSRVTVKSKKGDDPDFAPSVIYPIPITSFGIYTVNCMTCVPTTQQCKSITFTFADLSAAIAAGGVMGLLPTSIVCNATITSNGQITFDPNEYPIVQPNKNTVYNRVNLDVNVQPNLTTQTITTNNTYYPPNGYDGFSSVTVNVPSTIPSLQTLTITSNNTYYPNSGYDGFSSVTVNVPSTTPSLQTLTITSNNTYYPDSGYDGFSSVVANVQPRLQNITKSYTSNGTKYIQNESPNYDGLGRVTVNINVSPNLQTKLITSNNVYTPDSGYDGFSEVNVQVPPTTPSLQTLTITSNNTYYPDSGYDGFSSVTVNVPSPKTSLDKIQFNGDLYNINSIQFIKHTGNDYQLNLPYGKNLIIITDDTNYYNIQFIANELSQKQFTLHYGDYYYEFTGYLTNKNIYFQENTITFEVAVMSREIYGQTSSNISISQLYYYNNTVLMKSHYTLPTLNYIPLNPV